MHSLLHVPNQDNPTAPGLTSYGAHMLQLAPVMAIGTLDDDHLPWTTLLGGEPGFVRPLGNSMIGIRTLVVPQYDPVIQLLVGDENNGEVKESKNNSRIFSGLAIDLATRSRVKIAGRMVAGSLGSVGTTPATIDDGVGEAQLVLKIEQSLGIRISCIASFDSSSEINNRELPEISQQKENPRLLA